MGRRVLVLGYGNPGRQDDGLGPIAVETIESLKLPGVTTAVNYQLNIEDAADAAEYDAVLFVDAAEQGPEPYTVMDVAPAAETAFTSHVVRPEVILAISRDLYGKSPPARLVAIRGYEFELREELTLTAQANLGKALDQIKSLIGEWTG